MSNDIAFLETLVKEAYKKITALEVEVESAQRRAAPAAPEPIAVVGMGCRFPGADSPEAYWQLLTHGRTAISDVSPARWDPEPYAALEAATVSRTSWCRGGFLDQVDYFDPLFFRISPLEALTMDPQQRLLLEITWEALEHAGLAPDGLEESKTGVFIGMTAGPTTTDSDTLRSEKAMYAGTGHTPSIAAGRISYILGLQGPCFALDTACSSAMMAAHVAVGSLRAGECDLALAGGVNILTPEANVLMANAGWLAADGRCKTFDASADGHARSEGCGIVVLKRLTDAQRDGDKIWAVIRGSASNHDGRTSGLTVPNGPVQQSLIRQALQNAGVQPEAVSYSEAHATGTSLGDVIEVSALGAVYAQRPAPLLIGSVKPNLGHLESASGASSLMKLILMLHYGELAPHIGMQKPNPNIPWDALPIQVVTERRAWPTNSVTDKRIGGVSGFGFSGTNVHLILEEPPALHAAGRPQGQRTEDAPSAGEKVDDRPHHIFALSAKDQIALGQLAARYATYLAQRPELTLPDICFTASTGRAQFAHRLSVVSDNTTDLRDKLAAFQTSQRKLGVETGQAPTTRPKVAFLFSGLGGQTAGMGRQLYATAPVFREAIDRCEQLLSTALDQPLTQILYGQNAGQEAGQEVNGVEEGLTQTTYAEPALFAVEYALAQLWRSWGVIPDLVLGHSLGEYVAACVAGVLRLEDALRLVVERSRLIEAASSDGATASIFADPDRVTELIQPFAGDVSLAGMNSPEETLIAGRSTAVEQALVAAQEAGLDGRRLNVAHAAHSPLMEPVLDRFGEIAQTVTYRTPRIRLISSATGERCNQLDADHWRRHLREPVRFAESVAALQSSDCTFMVEIGPQPVLLWLGRQNWTAEKPNQWLPSLWSIHDDWKQLLQSLAQLYVGGVAVDWQGVYHGEPYQKVVLPTYPFQRKQYKLDSPKPKQERLSATTATDGLHADQSKESTDVLPTEAPNFPESVDSSAPEGKLLETLHNATLPERIPLILDFLRQQVASVLYLDPEQVLPDSNLVEFGMDSVMAMHILNGCRSALGFILYPRDLYERPVLSKFADYLATEFERIHGQNKAAHVGRQVAAQPSALAEVAERTFSASAQKNPPMLFVLSAPRSGSTLLRVMLAGHPALFAPPELHLLWLERMSEFPHLDYLGEGLQRTLMAQNNMDVAASQTLIDQWVAENRPIQEIYRLLQEAAAPKLLVDKSPSYGSYLNVLQRIEQLFDQPKYIHLVRHPYAMIDSFVRNRMERFGEYQGADAFSIAEQVWLESNRNTSALLADIPEDRHLTVRYEDMVQDARGQMARICDLLSIPFDEAMLHPYQGERMTDGVHAGSIPLGDMNFSQHNSVQPELAEIWRKVKLPRPLSDDAQQKAVDLGYTLPPPPVQFTAPVPDDPTAPLRAESPEIPMQTHLVDVRGLSICVCTWGPQDGPPVLCVHGLLDHGASWAGVATTLGRQGYRVIAPDLRGHGHSQHVGPGGTYHLMDFVMDLDAVVRSLDIHSIALIGHSMGATIAAFYAAARPERIDRLVLIEPHVPMSSQKLALGEQIVTQLDYSAMNLQHPALPNIEVAAEHLRRSIPSMSIETSRRMAERLTKPAEIHGDPKRVFWRWDPLLNTRSVGVSFEDDMGQEAYLSLLARIQAELTIVYGAYSDRNRPEEKALLRKNLPRSRFVEVAHGHNLHYDAPTEIAYALVVDREDA